MDSSYEGIPLEGLPPSYLKNGNIHYQTPFEASANNFVNGVQNIGSSITNGIQSIPQEVNLIKDRIVNKDYFLFDETNQNQDKPGDFVTDEIQSMSYKETFKPIGIKSNGCWEYSTNAVGNKIVVPQGLDEKPRFRSFSSPTQFQIELQQQIEKQPTSPNKNSGPIIKITTPILTSTDNTIYNERIRSLSLTSIEKIKQLEWEMELKNEPLDLDNIISYYDYQERIEREELERIDKNSGILSPNCQDSYTGLDIYNSNQSPIFSPTLVSRSTPNQLNKSNTIQPSINISNSIESPSPTISSYSVSLPSTPTKPPSPTPSPKETHQNCTTPTKFSLKRSLSSTLPKMSKSGSKINLTESPLTIKEELENSFQKSSNRVLSPNPLSNSSSSKETCKSPTTTSMNNSTGLGASSQSPKPVKKLLNPILSQSAQNLPKLPSKGLLTSHMVKSNSNGNISPSIKVTSKSSSKVISQSLNVEEYNQFVIQESFQTELRNHLQTKKESGFLKEKLEKFQQAKSNCKVPSPEPQEQEDRVKIVFTLPNTTKVTRYFFNGDKVIVMKDFIQYLSYTDSSLFGSRFCNDNEYKILDFDITYCLQPCKIKIQNFNVSFKDSGFKLSNAMTIGIQQKLNQ
ncbi:hypothetical protein DLAC_05663 [Tieghemostelium lacteum]|uniref:UBX domain-containing protein n=1 Tax=Tieghemostelium lacteum TaxID=361077 RepID=A0A151ZGF9_TIELA|nr:hypothetical protein DLAC_05663 [Tieghemostelium lacteum]|eukprot:KYQ93053.1 hypothetical protein DLAC_05663 [Tieghemostelium lacteum]